MGQNVATVGYENTIEAVTTRTELYTIIENHFESDLPQGKTEKKHSGNNNYCCNEQGLNIS